VELAVHGTLAAGAIDGRAVAILARGGGPPRPAHPLTDLPTRLEAHDRPQPDLADYNELIGGTR
ncbi:MAG: hypothetical protein M3N47_04165, partial [Chloroflexota bacterium]|nr:hypothetical protein [Chloroflexota bacterium]